MYENEEDTEGIPWPWEGKIIVRDHQNSVRYVFTLDGQTCNQSVSYNAWGCMQTTNGSPASFADLALGRGFGSHEQWPEVGLIHMNARLYDPVTGSFLSPDPEITDKENPQAYNRYAYCIGNPIKYWDPTGRRFWESIFNYVVSVFTQVEEMVTEVKKFVMGTKEGSKSQSGKQAGTSKDDDDGSSGPIKPIHLDQVNVTAKRITHSKPALDIAKTRPPLHGRTGMGGRNNSSGGSNGQGGWTDAAGHINDGIAGFGTGAGKLSGTFRLTDGANNGSNLSPKYYSSGWTGGSRAGISTYSAAEWGSRIGKGSIVASVGLGAYSIYNGYQQDGGTYGLNAQVATGQTIGGIGGGMAGAEIGTAIGVWFGGFGAIPGAVIGGVIGGWVGTEAGGATVLQIRK